MASPSAILIAHKDALARAYLRGVIERTQSGSTCREATTFSEVVDALSHQPATSLALIDIELPGMESELGLRFFALHFHQLRIAALCSALPAGQVERLQAAGIAACIPKELSENELAEALTTILEGRPFTPPDLSLRAVSRLSAGESAHAPALVDHELTERQCEVLRLVALGRSNREIAQMLDIAEGTVKVHVYAAFRVLGVHNRVSAAAAIRKRLESSQLEVGHH